MQELDSKEALTERLESLGKACKEESDLIELANNWPRCFGINLFGRLPDAQWQFVMREFPPLIDAALKFGRPARFTNGRVVWSMIDPATLADRFKDDASRLAADFKRLLDDEWRKELEGRSDYQRLMDEFAKAFHRFNEFSGMLADRLPQLEFALTSFGLSEEELKKLEQLVGTLTAPAKPKEGKKSDCPFPPPGKGKYPKFDDAQLVDYIKSVKSKYESGLDALTGFGGIALADTAVERMRENLADFDYGEICATLGAQKRRPPAGHGADDFYDLLAMLPQRVATNIDEHSAAEISERVRVNVDMLNRDDALAREEGFRGLRALYELLNWLNATIPGIPSRALADAREQLAREFEPRWAAVSGGPAHDLYLRRVVFTGSASVPQRDEQLPAELNPVKESVYAHVFLDRPLSAISTGMLFLEVGDDRFIMQVSDFPNRDSAYLRLDLLPDADVGKNPELIRFFGKALAAAGDELECVITPAGEKLAVGTLKVKLGKADAAKLDKRVEKLAEAAEENRTRDAVLPEIFTKPFKPYKDKALALDKLVDAIEQAWERNTHGEKIDVLAVRVNHYKGPGKEWREEFNPFEEPVQRLTDSFVGIVFKTADGRTCCVEDGIQFRQFYTRGKGYVGDLDVLFWGLKPFALPAEQVKRLAKN